MGDTVFDSHTSWDSCGGFPKYPTKVLIDIVINQSITSEVLAAATRASARISRYRRRPCSSQTAIPRGVPQSSRNGWRFISDIERPSDLVLSACPTKLASAVYLYHVCLNLRRWNSYNWMEGRTGSCQHGWQVWSQDLKPCIFSKQEITSSRSQRGSFLMGETPYMMIVIEPWWRKCLSWPRRQNCPEWRRQRGSSWHNLKWHRMI